MGARSYIPRLVRFLQSDSQPGVRQTHTPSNLLNETDPSGEGT
jgi:hypothetical protein